jgi:hypothetical protein
MRNLRSRRSIARSRFFQCVPVKDRTHDYVRHGTTSLVDVLVVKTGEIIAQGHQSYCSVELRKF